MDSIRKSRTESWVYASEEFFFSKMVQIMQLPDLTDPQSHTVEAKEGTVFCKQETVKQQRGTRA